jgi:hypothetical protein
LKLNVLSEFLTRATELNKKFAPEIRATIVPTVKKLRNALFILYFLEFSRGNDSSGISIAVARHRRFFQAVRERRRASR